MKNKVIKQYNQFHQVYSENLESQNELSNSVFHNAINIDLQDKMLLDLGCGDGSDLKILSDRGAKIYGIDPSEEFLETARFNNPEGVFYNGVAENLPFSSNQFDVVVSKWMIQNSFDVAKVYSEAVRVLKPNGFFVLLAKHPMMQWLEKIRDYGNGADYYKQQIVTSNIYGGLIQLKEPSHTLGDYFCPELFINFDVLDYQELTDFPASEQIGGKIYPTFFLLKAQRK